MSNNDLRAIMEELESLGWFEFGAMIEVSQYRDRFNIIYPDYGTKREYDKLELEELGVIDFIRSQLLNQGKYLKRDGAVYRILLPSENATQVQQLMGNADNKLKRAIKLAKNTPQNVNSIDIQVMVRASMKRESIMENIKKYE
jgi:hypothetical protein